MPAPLTYTIKNNSTNTNAIINGFEIITDTSKIQHYLNLSGWNSPYNLYTAFTGNSTFTTEVKTYQGDVSNINRVIQSFTAPSTITFVNEVSITTSWTAVGQPFAGTATIASFVGTNTVVFSNPFASTPILGEVVTFIPPQYLLLVNNTTNLQINWKASGTGYNGQKIVSIQPPNTLVMDGPPSQQPSGDITFSSDSDNMFEITTGSTKTFSMDYTNVTTTLGTYTSLVKIYAKLNTIPVIKTINNFMLISSVPVVDPDSPFYDTSNGGDGAGPADCADSSSTSCSVGGDAGGDSSGTGDSGGDGGSSAAGGGVE